MSEQETSLQTFIEKIPSDQLSTHTTSNLFVYFALNDPRMVERMAHFPLELYRREKHPFANKVLGWLEKDYPEIYQLCVKISADEFDYDLEKSSDFQGNFRLLLRHVLWILLNKSEFNKEEILKLTQ